MHFVNTLNNLSLSPSSHKDVLFFISPYKMMKHFYKCDVSILIMFRPFQVRQLIVTLDNLLNSQTVIVSFPLNYLNKQ